MTSSNALLSKPIMSVFAALTSLIVMLTSGCGDTDPNLLCRNDYLTVSKIYAPDTDPKSNTSQLQLFFYIEDNRNMQKINNKAFYISESEIRESDTAYFRGFTDAQSEDSYN